MLDYLMVADQVEREAKRLVVDRSSWNLSSSKSGVEVNWKPSPHFNGKLFRFTTKFEIPAKYVYDVMKPPATTKERLDWDKSIAHYERLRSISEDISLVRIYTHPALFGTIASREFVDIFNTKTYEKNDFIQGFGKSHWIFAKSIEDSSYPLNTKYVRAKNYPLGYGVIEDNVNPNVTHVELYVNTDIGGNLPQTIVEKALPSQQIAYIQTVKKEALRRYSQAK